MPGWLVAVDGKLTVALDITLSEELKEEGIARELVNRIQNLRKESGLELTDRISVKVGSNPLIEEALKNNMNYLQSEVLADSVDFLGEGNEAQTMFELEEGNVQISIDKK